MSKRGNDGRVHRFEAPPLGEDELATAREVAVRLRLRPSTVRRWANAGKIPSVRLSGSVLRFDMQAVLAVLKPAGGDSGAPR